MRKIIPPQFFYLFILLAIVLHFVFPMEQIIQTPYTYIGILFIVLGIIIDCKSWVLFRKEKTTIDPYGKPSKLQTTGTYKISRHPMYLGMTLILLGESILLGHLALFIFPILYVILIELFFIPLEERNLKKAFGKKYLDYKKKVRRWI